MTVDGEFQSTWRQWAMQYAAPCGFFDIRGMIAWPADMSSQFVCGRWLTRGASVVIRNPIRWAKQPHRDCNSDHQAQKRILFKVGWGQDV